ncbi:hypothetical protein IAT38_002596 [Cryptococcus sp. DSM 104549]
MTKVYGYPLPFELPFADLIWPNYHYEASPASIADLAKLVVSKKSLWAFVAQVAFNPIFWNIVARNEYRNKTITKIVKSPLIGCYILAVTIFSISAFRDHLFIKAVQDQPALEVLGQLPFKIIAVILFGYGQTFVLSSMWALGVTGTYLGDYFGILMSHRVTSFPFNVLSDPMYVGSLLTHLGTALWLQSPTGLILSAWVWIVYWVALKFEGPFTDQIYSASHKKSSPTPTTSAPVSVPATPSRRSGRIAAKASASDLDSDSDAKPTVAPTPRSRSTRKSLLKGELGQAAPGGARVTRSRSKGRVSTASGEE